MKSTALLVFAVVAALLTPGCSGAADSVESVSSGLTAGQFWFDTKLVRSAPIAQACSVAHEIQFYKTRYNLNGSIYEYVISDIYGDNGPGNTFGPIALPRLGVVAQTLYCFATATGYVGNLDAVFYPGYMYNAQQVSCGLITYGGGKSVTKYLTVVVGGLISIASDGSNGPAGQGYTYYQLIGGPRDDSKGWCGDFTLQVTN